MNLKKIINKIQSIHPEFSYEEIEELCLEYLVQFSDKTKESTKEKSLKKYLSKEFWIEWDEEEQENITEKKNSLASIPRYLFNYTNKKSADYIITIKWLSKQLWSTILFEDADLRIKPQDKIALIGKNGAWKSTFLKILLNPSLADKWEIEILRDLKIWFLSQDLFRESRERTVIDEMLTTFPEVTKTVERLSEIKELLDKGEWDGIALLEEQSELIEWMLMNKDLAWRYYE